MRKFCLYLLLLLVPCSLYAVDAGTYNSIIITNKSEEAKITFIETSCSSGSGIIKQDIEKNNSYRLPAPSAKIKCDKISLVFDTPAYTEYPAKNYYQDRVLCTVESAVFHRSDFYLEASAKIPLQLEFYKTKGGRSSCKAVGQK